MTHYVQYHNTAAMGYAYTTITDFDVFTNKSVSGLQQGTDTIWLIAGEGTSHKQFYLAYRFTVDDWGYAPEEGFRYVVRGTHGDFFFPPKIRLNGLPWWPDFQRSQSNFSLGLHPMRADFVPRFEDLATFFAAIELPCRIPDTYQD